MLRLGENLLAVPLSEAGPLSRLFCLELFNEADLPLLSKVSNRLRLSPGSAEPLLPLPSMAFKNAFGDVDICLSSDFAGLSFCGDNGAAFSASFSFPLNKNPAALIPPSGLAPLVPLAPLAHKFHLEQNRTV